MQYNKDKAVVPTAPAAGNLTVYTNAVGPLTKTYHLDAGGQLASRDVPKLAEGTFQTLRAETVAELADVIRQLTPSQALGWGVEKIGRAQGPITTKERADDSTPARSLRYFGWPAGPGWLMVDVDHVPEVATLESLRAVLIEAVPTLGELPMLGMSSASAMIYKKGDSTPLKGLSGARFYVPVAEATDIPALGHALHQRLILAGHGRAFVTRDGRVLVKSPVDAAVWSAERLDYAAGASLKGELKQRRIGPVPWNESAPGRLDRTLLPPLSSDEHARLVRIEAGIIAGAAEAAAAQRAAWLATRAAAGLSGEVKWNPTNDQGTLSGDYMIYLASGEAVTVREILSNPAPYHGRECKDPAEPDYRGGSDVAVIYSDQERPRIVSLAHGRVDYLLVRSPEAVFAADLDAVPPPSSAPAAEALPTEGERLAALTGDAEAVFLSELNGLQGEELWTRWEQLEAAGKATDPLAPLYPLAREAARAAGKARPAVIQRDVRAAMAGRADWAALSSAEHDLLLRAVTLSLSIPVERRTPRLITTVEPPEFLIEHILPRRGLVGMVGAPGQGKSWLGLEIAALIGGASGRFGGLEVRAQGPVWYFLSEDSHGFAARARAREQAHGAALHLHLFEEVPLLTAPISDLLAFLRAAREQRPESPVLVALDVFADTNTSGEDENAASTLIPLMRRARLIGRLLGSAVLLVHHSPKSDPEDARGSSAFKGALDVMVAVKQDAKGTISLVPKKFKASPLRRDLRFHVRDNVLQSGIDTVVEWGDAYTECDAAALAGRIGRELFVSKPVTMSAVKDRLRAERPEWFEAEDVRDSTLRSRRHSALQNAVKAGYLEEKGAGYVPGPKPPPEPEITIPPAAPATLEGVL